MQPPSDAVRSELEPLLRGNQKRLGQVYRLMDRGWTDQRIAGELGVGSSNFVSNNRNTVRAILEGRLPNGPSSASQMASSVRGLTKNAHLSGEASKYVEDLLEALTGMSGIAEPRTTTARSVRRRETPNPPQVLRELVDTEVKRRLIEVEQRVAAIGLDPEDYHAAAASGFALDVVQRLVSGSAMSRTTRALVDRRRLDLSIEQAVIDWSADLPLMASLVEDARGRLDYWRSQ